ncbi:hypothetical protein [Pseudobutyrivibrio ruminis]|uniref:hypothetical protein n=1 Tax=Pseudobutyrivibrio ruminis TaxID=46206 RepID=UPI0004207D25|nr:hypothetical protein [Pseudobutyrivibrio ruminis]
MSQSEDYLDGLLNSINKAKTDAIEVQEKAEKKQQQANESRKAVAYDDDFFTATGINVEEVQTKTSHPYLRKVLSEEDFLRQFEEELGSDDVDLFVSNFEQEIDDEERHFQETGELPESDNIVNNLLNNIKSVVKKETEELSEEPAIQLDDEIHEEVEEEVKEEEVSVDEESDFSDLESVMNDDSLSDDEAIAEPSSEDDEDVPLDLPTDDDIDLSDFIEEEEPEEEQTEEASSEDDDFGLSLDDVVEDTEEEPLDDSLKEFMPDEMDALDEAEFGEGEEPDLSGDGDLDLDNLLEGDDEDLLDIQSLLNGDEEGAAEGADIDDSAEEASGDDVGDDAGDDGKKGKKKGKKEKKKKEKGEKKPNPIIEKLLLIIFGAPDEDEIAEMEAEKAKKEGKTVEITYDEEGNPIVPEEEEDPKEKKKRLKEEKKAAKEAAKKEKEAAKKEKEAAKKDKPPKPPKPKKEKKPKEPDNSPKIPISIIATFLVLSISIIGVVMVGMTFTGLKRHMEQATTLFEEGNYIAAYEKLNGFDFRSDEEVELLRNQARTLADLQTCQQQYEAFIKYEQYPYALDSLLIGMGRYDKYKDDAVEYGISEQYEAYGNQIKSELEEQFGLSEEEALAIYNQPNRHYYTIELRKVLRGLGLPDL